jgi:hypothetical protein
MATFCHLPRELRDKIADYFVKNERLVWISTAFRYSAYKELTKYYTDLSLFDPSSTLKERKHWGDKADKYHKKFFRHVQKMDCERMRSWRATKAGIDARALVLRKARRVL